MRNRLIEAVDIVTGGKLSAYFREAASDDGEPVSDRGKYRKLTSSQRDLAPLEYAKIQEMAFYLWQRNPLAHRIIEIAKDFCAGEELSVSVKIMKRQPSGDIDTKKPDAQKVWDDFYADPYNRLNTEFGEFVTDFFLNGELICPTFINKASGSVRLGYIDPMNVREVICDPMNVREVKTLLFSKDNSIDKVPLAVIRMESDVKEPAYGKLSGECFYFRSGKVVNQKRGAPMLAELVDWIDALDQFLFDSLEGFVLRNAFMWDVTMEGADEKDLLKKAIAPPKPGSTKLHNEKVKWEVLAPDLKSQDVAEAMRLVKNFILAGKGYPEHWFADGGNTNLATADAMSIPVMKMLKAKQAEVKNIIRFMAQYVLDQTKLVTLAEGEYYKIEVSAFDFERKDASVISNAFVQLVTAAISATDKGWMSEQNAKKLVDGMLQKLGIEVDPTETVEQIALARDKKNLLKDADDAAGLYDDVPPMSELLAEGFPLALQQIALARQRAVDVGDKDLAKKLGDKIEELLKKM